MKFHKILASATIFFVSLFAKASATDDHGLLKAINQELHRIGYIVDVNADHLDANTTDALIQHLIRIGREDSYGKWPLVLELLANEKAGDEFPCIDLKDNVSTSDTVDVSITFSGDHPEEFLADFYVRLSDCYPDSLKPKEINKAPRLKTGKRGTPIDTAMPVHQTKRSVESYIEAIQNLSVTAEGVQPRQQAPSLTPQVDDRLIEKTLSTASYTFSDGSIVVSDAARPPTRRVVRRTCRKLFLSQNICTENVKVFEEPITRKQQEYAVTVPHYVIHLKFQAPASFADQIVNDAMSFVEARHQRHGGQTRPFQSPYYVEDSYIPMSTDPILLAVCPNSIDGVCDSDVMTGKLDSWIKIFEASKAIVDWVPPTQEKNIRLGLLTIDPGVEDITLDMTVPSSVTTLCDAKPGNENSNYIIHADLCSISNSMYSLVTGALLLGDSRPTEGMGHSLHVSHLASGVSGELSYGGKTSNWAGFGDDNRIRTITATKKHFLENFLRAQGTGKRLRKRVDLRDTLSKENDFGPVIMHTYGPKECHDRALRTTQFTKEAKADALSINSNANEYGFEVFSLPYLRCMTDEATKLNDRNCIDGLTLAPSCFARYRNAIAVAPIMPRYELDGVPDLANSDDGRDWVLMPGATETPKCNRNDLSCDYSRNIIFQTENRSESFDFHSSGDYPTPVLAAPGYALASIDFDATLPNKSLGVGVRSGTSVATPIVTALVSRILARWELSLSGSKMKDWLFANSTPIEGVASGEGAYGYNVIGIANFKRSCPAPFLCANFC